MSSANIGYSREKMKIAVDGLACGTGPLEDRVFGAFLSFHILETADLPADLQKDFEWVHGSFRAGACSRTDKPARLRRKYAT